jgi:hypothetical protein
MRRSRGSPSFIYARDEGWREIRGPDTLQIRPPREPSAATPCSAAPERGGRRSEEDDGQGSFYRSRRRTSPAPRAGACERRYSSGSRHRNSTGRWLTLSTWNGASNTQTGSCNGIAALHSVKGARAGLTGDSGVHSGSGATGVGCGARRPKRLTGRTIRLTAPGAARLPARTDLRTRAAVVAVGLLVDTRVAVGHVGALVTPG